MGVTHSCSAGRVGGGQGGSEEGALEQEEEEEEEEEAVAEVLRATSSSFRNSHSEIWIILRALRSGSLLFYSGYSPCVSSQRLWFSSSFSACWTRILRSFLNLDILLLTPGIWQPLVRCLPCPGYTEKLDFLRDDFSHYFLRVPCIWQSLYCVWCCLWTIGLWIFREMTPGMVSVLNTPRFGSGHIGVSLRSLLEEFPSYFNAMLGSTVDTSLCVRLRRLGVTGYDARRNVMCGRAENCGFSAVAVPRRSCSSSSQLRSGSVSRSRLLLDQEILQLLVTVIDVPVVQDERDPHVPSWRRQSCSHGCTVVAFVLRSSSSSR